MFNIAFEECTLIVSYTDILKSIRLNFAVWKTYRLEIILMALPSFKCIETAKNPAKNFFPVMYHFNHFY